MSSSLWHERGTNVAQVSVSICESTIVVGTNVAQVPNTPATDEVCAIVPHPRRGWALAQASGTNRKIGANPTRASRERASENLDDHHAQI
jgi:hypothetical protein